jgi:hypothetical protein
MFRMRTNVHKINHVHVGVKGEVRQPSGFQIYYSFQGKLFLHEMFLSSGSVVNYNL